MLRGLTLAKAYHPELDPTLLAGSFPQFKEDNSELTKEDYAAVVKATRHYACAIAREIDLSTYQPDYDENRKNINLELPIPFELVSKPHNPAKPPSSQAPSSSGTFSTLGQPSTHTANEETLQALHQIFRPENIGGEEVEDEVQEQQEKPEEPSQVDLAATEAQMSHPETYPTD